MNEKTLLQLAAVISGFILMVGIVITILSPGLGLLLWAVLALTITLMFLQQARICRILTAKFRKARTAWREKRRQEQPEVYDHTFKVAYQLVENNHGKTTAAPITREIFVIGRHNSCDMVIGDSQTVARTHCRIIYRKYSHEYYIEDMGSTNGTFLGTKRLNPYTQEKLMLGAEITISNRTYRFLKLE